MPGAPTKRCGFLRSITTSFVVPSTLKVMPEGDSITNGSGDTQAIDEGGYRLALGNWMNTIPHGCTMSMIGPYDNAFPNGQGKHDGLVGTTIVDHISTLQGYLTGSYPADLLLMMLGTNDLLNGDSAATALGNMATLLAAARTARSSIKIILSTIVDNSDSAVHTKIVSFNSGLSSTVATENAAGGHVELIDNYTAVGLHSGTQFYDGTHPNHIGYGLMEPVWQNAIDYRITHWT